jgi:hypothetical protein
MIEDKFFDRQYYLDVLEKRINALKDGYSRQNIAIIGDELIGKTSIIFKFLDKFQDNHIIILYLEIRQESVESFIKRFIGVLLYNFLVNSNIRLEEDTDYLIKNSEKFIPKTTEKIRLILNSLKRKKISNIFSEMLGLCEIVHQETSKFCVVIFDEFQHLQNLGFKNLYRDWSRLLITQKNTMYIIISSMKYKAKAILSRNLTLLFGNFEIILIEPFNIKTTEQYFEYKLSDLNLNKGLKNFLVHFTGGYPFYLELISDTLLKSNQPDLTDILEDLLFDSQGTLNQRFSNYIKRFLDSPLSNDCISILYLISSGKNRIKEILHLLHKPKKEIMQRINYLLEFDTITRNGDFLKINDRVFAFWLRFVYHGKLQSLTVDARYQKERFCDNIKESIQDFLRNAEKPVTERISELMQLFEDEIIQIERKKIRLNHFREIKSLEFNNVNLKEGLIGRSNDSLWIFAIKLEPLTENDITEFAKECKKYRHKLKRNIILSLQGFDANTRLRALEEKIWTWDINNLNQILDVFSKPWVVI